MGTICTGQHQSNQSNVSGSRILNPSKIKNMPLTSYAYQVVQPQIHRNVQMALHDPNLRSNKSVDVGGKPFFYIPSKKAYYQGQFNENRLPHGFGIAIFQDGTYYQGQFKDGEAFDDEGVIIFTNGAHYKGEIHNSTMNGQGTLIHKNVYSFKGKFKNGVPESGQQSFKEQNSNYKGNFNEGYKAGNGVYTWDNGASKYNGQFARGLMHDKSGIIQSKGGIRYNGQFKLGKRQGEGTIQTQDGVLQGNFKNDEINGPGKFKWKDGKVYEGQFRKSQFDGKGKIIYPNGKKVEGQWANNHNQFVSALKN